jgi:hypothetical protein
MFNVLRNKAVQEEWVKFERIRSTKITKLKYSLLVVISKTILILFSHYKRFC